MAMRESSGRYDCVNQFGFLGRYQFGKMRLIDLGLIDAMMQQWRFGLTDELFLASPELQDAAFDVHVAKHASVIRIRYAGRFNEYITLSGCVAVAHLVGLGGLSKWMRGVDQKDGLGTTASEYATTFKGYDIPMGLPRAISSDIICGILDRTKSQP